MAYLIDGHNLIPHLPGFSLAQVDDEERLIAWLGQFCRQNRKTAEVFFDGAPPGFIPRKSFGRLVAHYVRQGTAADEAIRRRLGQLGRSARNWTVVTSDRQVQSEARQAHAQVLSSEAFAQQLLQAAGQGASERPEVGSLSPEEIERWLAEFGGDQPDRRAGPKSDKKP